MMVDSDLHKSTFAFAKIFGCDMEDLAQITDFLRQGRDNMTDASSPPVRILFHGIPPKQRSVLLNVIKEVGVSECVFLVTLKTESVAAGASALPALIKKTHYELIKMAKSITNLFDVQYTNRKHTRIIGDMVFAISLRQDGYQEDTCPEFSVSHSTVSYTHLTLPTNREV